MSPGASARRFSSLEWVPLAVRRLQAAWLGPPTGSEVGVRVKSQVSTETSYEASDSGRDVVHSARYREIDIRGGCRQVKDAMDIGLGSHRPD